MRKCDQFHGEKHRYMRNKNVQSLCPVFKLQNNTEYLTQQKQKKTQTKQLSQIDEFRNNFNQYCRNERRL